MLEDFKKNKIVLFPPSDLNFILASVGAFLVRVPVSLHCWLSQRHASLILLLLVSFFFFFSCWVGQAFFAGAFARFIQMSFSRRWWQDGGDQTWSHTMKKSESMIISPSRGGDWVFSPLFGKGMYVCYSDAVAFWIFSS